MYDFASTQLAECASLVGQLRRRDEQAALLIDQGFEALTSGRLDQAEQLLRSALAAYEDMHAPVCTARAQELLAATLAARGEWGSAVPLWKAGEMTRSVSGTPIWPIDQARQAESIAQACVALGSEQFQAIWRGDIPAAPATLGLANDECVVA